MGRAGMPVDEWNSNGGGGAHVSYQSHQYIETVLTCRSRAVAQSPRPLGPGARQVPKFTTDVASHRQRITLAGEGHARGWRDARAPNRWNLKKNMASIWIKLLITTIFVFNKSWLEHANDWNEICRLWLCVNHLVYFQAGDCFFLSFGEFANMKLSRNDVVNSRAQNASQ